MRLVSPQVRINGNARANTVSARAPASRPAGGASFAVETGGSPERASAAPQTSAATSIALLLALQAVEDPLFAKRKSVRRGQSMLDTLEEIKADLLLGRVSEGRLNQLMALVSQAREKSVPGLDALIDDIELRVRVELAKFGRYPAP